MPSKRPCRECGKLVQLRITRDLTRKFYCDRVCRSTYTGRQKDMAPLWAKSCTPEANAKKGKKGSQHNLWKPVGSKRVTDHGYVMVKVADSDWQYEHRIVAKPDAKQVTHHKNGVKTDNRPENLEILTPSEHITLHGRMRTDFGRRWSVKFEACRDCNGTSRHHVGLGLCTRCYQRKPIDVSQSHT